MMFGLYFFLSVFAAPPVAFAAVPAADFGRLLPSSELSVSFTKLSGIEIGTPVVAKGHVIGRVSAIEIPEQPESFSSKKGNAQYQVRVALDGIALIDGTLLGAATSDTIVALQTTPVTASRNQPETVVELFAAPPAEPKARSCSNRSAGVICGYSTYEEFWSAVQSGGDRNKG